MAGGARAHSGNVAAEIAQGVELMHADLAQRAARRAFRIPAPVLRRYAHAAVVGEIGLDLADFPELASIDRGADGAHPAEQARAVSDHDTHAVRLFQRGDGE